MTARIAAFEIFQLNLPFRSAFEHAAADRTASESLLVNCVTDLGIGGFGETLPRPYVTGEACEETFDFLKREILPRLLGREFASLREVTVFLESCDGEPPREWAGTRAPRTAAWCAVDLALLDTFGKVFGKAVTLDAEGGPPGRLRFSPVLSAGGGWRFFKTLLKVRAYGFRQVKLKVNGVESLRRVRWARRVLGSKCDIRVDANMSWTPDSAFDRIRRLAALGVRVFEQPLPAEDVQGAARLVRETGVRIMADESFHTRASLERLIRNRACSAVNVRISKCGGLVASLNRCRQAAQAGLEVQVGSHPGETSLTSAAQLALLAAFKNVRYAEGCYGNLLLVTDPAQPRLQFGYGGRPPVRPVKPGLGVEIDEGFVRRTAVRHEFVGP